ncbi:hypothetical protein LCGC14_0094070 [marine sediment metagenome]|uniref:Lipoprotein n=1 Tax=marine sediment metagenome TaxID=412755 RepID=A0A0F9VU75_9ZZZZ|nr:hypothetical protein [Phycisphaerae bacterium]HDZ44441.1 hypothetical protein [Phycisphaerae bacterium]
MRLQIWAQKCEMAVVIMLLAVAVLAVGCRRADEVPTPVEQSDHSDTRTADEDKALPLLNIRKEALGVSYEDMTASEWTTSADGVLSLRLLTPKEATVPGEPVLLFAEIRNDTDEPITILRPFGFEGNAWVNIRVTRPDGVQITGAEPPSYGIVDPFKVLGPRMKWLDVTKLKAVPFTGIDQAGEHAIEFSYIVGRSHVSELERCVKYPDVYQSVLHQPAPPRPPGSRPVSTAPSSAGSKDVPALWIGEIHSAAITITKGE